MTNEEKLMELIKKRNNKKIIKFVDNHLINMNYVYKHEFYWGGEFEETPLMCALRYKLNKDVIMKLIEVSNLKFIDKNGCSALNNAFYFKADKEVIDKLIKAMNE